MKNIIPTLLAAILLTGCFAPIKTHKSYASAKTYQDGKLTGHFKWRDTSMGGGIALFADPKASRIVSDNVNQAALGGGSSLNVGEIASTARPDAITATGGAVGEGASAFVGGKIPKVPFAPSLPKVGIPGEQVVKIGDNIFKREPDIYGIDGKLYRFDGEKMIPLLNGE